MRLLQKKTKIASFARDMLAEYREAEDLINIGAYASGTNKKIDEAIYYHEHIINFLKQGINEKSSFNETISSLRRVLNKQLKKYLNRL